MEIDPSPSARLESAIHIANKVKSLFSVVFAGSRAGGALVLVISLFTIDLINAGISSLRINGEPLPEYGTWTGIATLERKLCILREFASQGPVDAIILGSSMSDHGLSAAVLSHDLSVAYGKPFRVFNLSTGGAEICTFPLLYRLARTVAKPKQIWIAFPVEQKAGDGYDVNPRAPDYALLQAPAGTALRHPFLLPLSFRLFQVPIVRHATALRDLATHGKFVNRPTSLMDVYDFDAFGDTRGFLYFSGAQPFEAHRHNRRNLVLSLARQYAAAPDERAKTDTYFSRSALDAIAQIRAFAAHDHFSITILAHDTAAGLAIKDGEYMAASELFYKQLSERFGAPVIDVRASFQLASYNFADTSHLNSNGADEISALMAAKIANRPLPQFSRYAVAREGGQALPDPNLTPYTAVVLRKASDTGEELQLRYVQGPGVAPLRTPSRVQLVMLLPNNSTVAVPARVVSRGQVLADTSALPVQAGDQALLVQLTAAGAKWGGGLSQPLSSYRWSVATRSEERTQGPSSKVFTGANSYTPLDRIRASWTGIDRPAPKDWVGVFPVGGGNETRLSVQWTGGRAAGTFDLPPNPTAKPGQYELRLYANAGWDLMAFSKPFSIGPLAVTIESSSNTVKRGAPVHAVWSKLDPPSMDDWVGLFPRGGPDQARLELKFTAGKSEGAVDLAVPSNVPLGDYELRLYAAGGWTLLARSTPFKVIESYVRLTVDRSNVQPGDLIRARWAGMDSPEKDDWIGLFPKGWKQSVRTAYQPTGGTASGELSLTIPPPTAAGEYELRLYAHDSWQLVATSGPFRIRPKPARRR